MMNQTDLSGHNDSHNSRVSPILKWKKGRRDFQDDRYELQDESESEEEEE